MGSATSINSTNEECQTIDFFEVINNPSNPQYLEYNWSTSHLFGRLDRMELIDPKKTNNLPLILTTRPSKKVLFDMPFSFAMGPKLLNKIPTCESLYHFMKYVISLEDVTIDARMKLIKEGKLDHVLMIFSGDKIPTQPASLDGILFLLKIKHPEIAKRYEKVLPNLREFVGSDKFQTRIAKFQDYWGNWYERTTCMWTGGHPNGCNCKHKDFDMYCVEFDEFESQKETDKSILLIREMMYILLSCNKYFGMDGYTYDENGMQVGEEFLALNLPLKNKEGEDMATIIILSDIEKFKVV